MTTPTTAETWWQEVDEQWEHIVEIFHKCNAPLDDTSWSDSLEQSQKGLQTVHDKTLLQTLEHARDERDHTTLHNFLELCWIAAPDKPYIHQWRGWGNLCDLCSEYPVCFEKELLTAREERGE